MKINRKSNNIIFALYNSSCPFVRDANSTASRVLVEYDNNIYKDDKCACICKIYCNIQSVCHDVCHYILFVLFLFYPSIQILTI